MCATDGPLIKIRETTGRVSVPGRHPTCCHHVSLLGDEERPRGSPAEPPGHLRLASPGLCVPDGSSPFADFDPRSFVGMN